MIQDLNCAIDANFASMGTCFIQKLFYGELVWAGIVCLIVFAFLLYRLRMSWAGTIPILTIVIYALNVSIGNIVFNSLFNLMIIANAAVFVLGVIKYVRR